MTIPQNYLRAIHRTGQAKPNPKCPTCSGAGVLRIGPHTTRCLTCFPPVPANTPQSPVAVPLEQKPVKAKAVGLGKPQGRRAMNKTEAAMIPPLEARKQAGEISRYEWEGVTLRWPDGMRYTPDFAVWRNGWMKADGITAHWQDMLFIETKGAFIEGDALVKFRAARAHWPEFMWEMWQRKKGNWEKVL